jgi:hypothetical protein
MLRPHLFLGDARILTYLHRRHVNNPIDGSPQLQYTPYR